MKHAIDEHPNMNLKLELEKLMFDDDKKPVSICENDALFTMVMSAFSNYEKQVNIVIFVR